MRGCSHIRKRRSVRRFRGGRCFRIRVVRSRRLFFGWMMNSSKNVEDARSLTQSAEKLTKPSMGRIIEVIRDFVRRVSMSLRSVLQGLFQGQPFTDLVAKVDKISADMLIVVTAVTSMAHTVNALDLPSLHAKLDLILLGDGSLTLPDTNGASIGEVVAVPVFFKGDPLLEISAFGFGGGGSPGFAFNSAHFMFRGVTPGAFLTDWQGFDGNETNPGEVTIGGFAGGGTPIDGGQNGVLFYVNLEILVDTFTESQVRLDNYVDDVANFKPQPVYGRVLFGQ